MANEVVGQLKKAQDPVPPPVSTEAPVGSAPEASPGMLSSLLSGAGSLMGNLKNPDGSINWSNPALPLMIGGGLGTGASLLSSATTSDEEKKKKWLRNAALSGLLGGVGGMGAAAFMNQKKKLNTLTQSEIDDANTPHKVPFPEAVARTLDKLTDGAAPPVTAIRDAGRRLSKTLGPEGSVAAGALAGAGIGTAVDRHNASTGSDKALAKALSAAQSLNGKPGERLPSNAPGYHLPNSPDVNKLNDKLVADGHMPITQAQINQQSRAAYATLPEKVFGIAPAGRGSNPAGPTLSFFDRLSQTSYNRKNPSTRPDAPVQAPPIRNLPPTSYRAPTIQPAQRAALREFQGSQNKPSSSGSTPPPVKKPRSHKVRGTIVGAGLGFLGALDQVQPMSKVDRANEAAAAQTKAKLTKTQRPIVAPD